MTGDGDLFSLSTSAYRAGAANAQGRQDEAIRELVTVVYKLIKIIERQEKAIDELQRRHHEHD